MGKKEQNEITNTLKKRLGYTEQEIVNINDYYTSPDRINRNFRHSGYPADYFPWEDVAASVWNNTNDITYIDKECRVCGEQLVKIKFKSPQWTWRQLCGRAGDMILCVNCPCQIQFKLIFMN